MSEISHAGWCSRKRCIGECWGRGSPEHASVLEETIAELEASLATAQERVKELSEALDNIASHCECDELCNCSTDMAEAAHKALAQPPTAEKE